MGVFIGSVWEAVLYFMLLMFCQCWDGGVTPCEHTNEIFWKMCSEIFAEMMVTRVGSLNKLWYLSENVTFNCYI